MSEHRHHIWPTSRDGRDDDANQYPLERWGEEYHTKHDAWHRLFAYMTPPEVTGAIRAYMRDNGDIEEKFFRTSFEIKKGLIDLRVAEWVEFTLSKTDSKKVQKKKNDWRLLFGESMSALNSIEWIEREFIRKKWYWQES